MANAFDANALARRWTASIEPVDLNSSAGIRVVIHAVTEAFEAGQKAAATERDALRGALEEAGHVIRNKLWYCATCENGHTPDANGMHLQGRARCNRYGHTERARVFGLIARALAVKDPADG